MRICIVSPASSDNPKSIHGRLGEKERGAGECVGFWKCVTHFTPFISAFGIRIDKVELGITVITGGFCCGQDFLPVSLEKSLVFIQLT